MAMTVPFVPESQEEIILQAARVVAAGGLVAIPTESYYALGASPVNAQAVERVFQVKQRPERKPLLVLVADLMQLSHLVQSVPRAASLLMERFWPGPLTLVFVAAASLSPVLTGGTGSIGIRLPASPLLLDLLRRVGPLTGTSANRSGASPVTTAEEVQRAVGEDIQLILDGGRTAGGPPSTIVDVRGPIRLVREGALPVTSVVEALESAGLHLSFSTSFNYDER